MTPEETDRRVSSGSSTQYPPHATLEFPCNATQQYAGCCCSGSGAEGEGEGGGNENLNHYYAS
eukprot:4673819-Pyramimonas_sp.AAC.1